TMYVDHLDQSGSVIEQMFMGPPSKGESPGSGMPKFRRFEVERVWEGPKLSSLATDELERAVREHQTAVYDCYRDELPRYDDPTGDVVVELAVGRTGSVIAADIPKTDLPDTSFEECLLTEIRGWKLAAPTGPGPALLRHTFRFTPALYPKDD
ncbi:MAG: AgmX/PglI C-terminal domain-containing protein, partial [Deltaproteobacteria bacterium]|nr:AgmX/PglI C-terminal domain-containing protein [Deltaproteobacteria bacterium]